MAELREGVTYQSGCTLLNATVDTEEIPAPVEQPTRTTLPVCLDRTIVVFDLETSSLSRSSEITQVAALVLGSDVVTSFNQYLMPAGSISSEASKVTGLCPLHISRSDAPIGLRCSRRQFGTKPSDVASAHHSHWPNGAQCVHSCRLVR